MKIIQSIGHDFAYPLGGFGLAVYGIVFAICGLCILIIRHICKPTFLMIAAIMLFFAVMVLFSIGQLEWSGRVAEIAWVLIACFGASIMVESVIKRRRRKAKKN